jgi:lipopolysaccharide export system protein LptA
MAAAEGRRVLLALAGWLLVPCLAWGLASDRGKPIQIEADRATLDEKAGVSVYEGNVHMQQGTLQLRGQRMTVRVRDSQVTGITIDGRPASFSQRPDGADSDQHAEADHIEYHAAEQRLILEGNALIRQSDKEQFSSNRIVIRLRDNTVSAGDSSSGSRVRITLQPDIPPPEVPDTTEQDATQDTAGDTAPAAGTGTEGTP